MLSRYLCQQPWFLCRRPGDFLIKGIFVFPRGKWRVQNKTCSNFVSVGQGGERGPKLLKLSQKSKMCATLQNALTLTCFRQFWDIISSLSYLLNFYSTKVNIFLLNQKASFKAIQWLKNCVIKGYKSTGNIFALIIIKFSVLSRRKSLQFGGCLKRQHSSKFSFTYGTKM